MCKIKLVTGLMTLLLPIVSWAEPASFLSNYSIPQQFNSVRALGMGNAFTAVADDYSAIFYNPAALARRKEGLIRMSVSLGASDKFFDFSNDINKALDTPDIGTDKENAVNDVLEKYYGDNFHATFPKLYGVWARPNWSVAFVPADFRLDMVINKSGGGPAISLNLLNDTTLAYGYGRDVDWLKGTMDGQLSVGVTAKLIQRLYMGEIVSASKVVLDDGDFFDDENAAGGLTADFDFGVMFTPKLSPSNFFSSATPTFSMVLRNAIDMGFTKNLKFTSEESNEPPKLGRRLDIGSHWNLPDFWIFDPHLSVDFRDMLHNKFSLKKGSHIGAEFYWKVFDWWKGSWTVGLNQSYLTYGIGARIAAFNLDLVSYGEEVGVADFEVESRRYMLELSLEF